MFFVSQLLNALYKTIYTAVGFTAETEAGKTGALAFGQCFPGGGGGYLALPLGARWTVKNIRALCTINAPTSIDRPI